jgi:hypothetical protein
MTRLEETPTQLDDAIDDILAGERGPVAHHEGELMATARLLRRALPRLHPGPSFEEHLAARLAAARRIEPTPATDTAASGSPVTPTPIRPGIGIDPPAVSADDAAHDRRRRNLVAGGAIASGVSIALPIAGAAIVAWRRSRSSGGML